MVGAHRAARVGGLIERRQDVDGTARIRAEVVPLVGSRPAGKEVPGRGVGPVGDVDDRRLDRRVLFEVGAEQPAVEGPVVLGVRRGVDADPAAAVADVALEGFLLARGSTSPEVLRKTTASSRSRWR
jgi:hypothetical protein